MKIKAFAKVNLLLKIVGKKENGYHELQMLNTKIDIYDEIEITEHNIDELYFINSFLDSKKDDLVMKCLKFIKNIYNIKESYQIKIKKNIPIGAGLGGGSSDAAAIIKYVLEKHNIKLTKSLVDELSMFSADIPFFLYKGVCFVEGIGEQVQEFFVNIPKEFIIINPNIYISTKEVFKNNQVISKKISYNELVCEIKEKKYYSFINDLEDSCFNLVPKLKQIKNKLCEIGYCTMTGSGSTMLLFNKKNDMIDDVYTRCCELYPKFYIKKVKIV